MSKIYIPEINEDIFLDTKDMVLGDYRLIILVQLIYELDKRYKIEKIISFNNKSYEKEKIFAACAETSEINGLVDNKQLKSSSS